MSETKSLLVKSVLALDELLQELERVGNKINSMEMKTDFDVQHGQKLMVRFAECGEEMSKEILNLSQHLAEARARAEAIAAQVSERATQLGVRKDDEQEKLQKFLALSEKVRELSSEIKTIKPPEGKELTPEEKATVSQNLTSFLGRLNPLIEDARVLQAEAEAAKMKNLSRSAQSLTQTLHAVREKISSVNLQ